MERKIWYAIVNPDEEAAAERGEDVAFSWDWEGASALKEAVRIAERLRADGMDVRTIVAVEDGEYDHHYTRDEDGDWVSSVTESWQF